ncbi:MAG: ankyrin repeat domain-containing protein [Rhabdochlamydiaceae bacterium]
MSAIVSPPPFSTSSSDLSHHQKGFSSIPNSLGSDFFYQIWTPNDPKEKPFNVSHAHLHSERMAMAFSQFLKLSNLKKAQSSPNPSEANDQITESQKNIFLQDKYDLFSFTLKQPTKEFEKTLPYDSLEENLEVENEYSQTPLLLACSQEDEEIILSLLPKLSFEALNHVDQYGNSALILSIWNGHISVAKHLLEKGCDPSLTNDEGISPLMLSAFLGYEDLVGLLINHSLVKADIDAVDESGRTPLFFACLKSKKKTPESQQRIVDLLLDRGSDPLFKNEEGISPLTIAIHANNPLILSSMFEVVCRFNPSYLSSDEKYIDLRYAILTDNEKAIRFYLEKTIDVTYQLPEDRQTLLMIASYFGTKEMIQDILKTHNQTAICFSFKNLIDLTYQFPKDRQTLLMIASYCSKKELVQNILKDESSSSFINAKDFLGRTALGLATSIGDKEIVKLLLKSNADRFLPDIDKITPLMIASFDNYVEICSLLLNNLDELKKRDYMIQKDVNQNTCFTIAISRKRLETVQFLIQQGYPLDYQHSSGKTPLITACEVNKIPLEIVTALLENIDGGELESYLNKQDMYGNTALHLALQNENFHLVDTLLAKGADPLILNKKDASSLLCAIQSQNIESILKLLKHVSKKKLKTHLKILDKNLVNHHIANAVMQQDDPDSLEKILSYGIDVFSTKTRFFLFMQSIHLNKKNMFERLFSPDLLNQRDGMNQTPLILACVSGHLKIADTLMNKPEVNLKAKDDDGDNALICLLKKARNANWDEKELVLFNKIFHRLVDSYEIADINHVNKQGVSPFIIACQLEDPSLVACLIEKGCDYMVTLPPFEATPLMIVCLKGNKKVFDVLIKRSYPPSYLSKVDKDDDSLLSILSMSGESEIFSILLEKGLSFETQNKEGKTPLMIASRRGHLNIVEQILERASSSYINQKQQSSGRHALFFAVENKQLEILKKLVDKGGDLRVEDNEGMNLLTYAVKNEHWPIVQFLLPYFSSDEINATGKKIYSLLAYSAAQGNYLISKALLEKGANPVSLGALGNPLTSLLRKEKNHQLFRLFLKYIDTAEKIKTLLANGQVLFKSIQGKQHVFTKWLIQQGIDLKSQDYFRNNHSPHVEKITPLMLAVDSRQQQTVALITKAISDLNYINEQNETGLSALLIAVKHGNLSLVNHLLKKGAIAHLTNKNKISPLLLACYQRNLKIVKALLPHLSPSDINLKDPFGYTPIMIAAQRGEALIISHLLKCKADPFLQNKDQETALLLAVKSQSHNALLTLLKGVSYREHINHRNKEERTALMLASLQESEDMREVLLKEKVDPSLKDKYGLRADDLLHLIQNVNFSSPLHHTLDKSAFDWLVQSISDQDHDLMNAILAKINSKSINQKTKEGETLLTIAAKKGLQKPTEKLLEKKADPFMLNAHSESAISIAIDQKNAALLQTLLAKTSNLDNQEKLNDHLQIKDKNGETLLSRASSSDELKSIINEYVPEYYLNKDTRSELQENSPDFTSPPDTIIFPPSNTLTQRKKPSTEKKLKVNEDKHPPRKKKGEDHEEKQPLIKNQGVCEGVCGDDNLCIIS